MKMVHPRGVHIDIDYNGLRWRTRQSGPLEICGVRLPLANLFGSRFASAAKLDAVRSCGPELDHNCDPKLGHSLRPHPPAFAAKPIGSPSTLPCSRFELGSGRVEEGGSDGFLPLREDGSLREAEP